MALVLAPWFCNGFVTMEIGIGILVFLVLIKNNSIITSIFFTQKATQNENETGNGTTNKTYSPMDSHTTEPSTNFCSTSRSSTFGDLGYEQQITILVCDNVDEGHTNNEISLRDRNDIKRLRKKVHDAFDCLCVDYGLVKSSTNGSSYVVASRLQGAHVYDPDQDPAIQIIRFALACQQKLRCLVSLIKPESGNNVVSTMRFGIHMGTVLSTDDKLGHQCQQNCFTKVIDRASVMQRTSLPGQIHLSKSIAKHLKSIGMEPFVNRRSDGRLVIATYWLSSRSNEDGQQSRIAEPEIDICNSVV